MAELLDGIPRVDPTSRPTVIRRAVGRLLQTNLGSAVHRNLMAPSWYYNLLKNRRCQLFADGRSDSGGTFVARLTEGVDHERLLALAERYMSNFKAYVVNTQGIRDIPVLRLTPEARQG